MESWNRNFFAMGGIDNGSFYNKNESDAKFLLWTPQMVAFPNYNMSYYENSHGPNSHF